jgi:uncharacterized protein (TIGR02186 family)
VLAQALKVGVIVAAVSPAVPACAEQLVVSLSTQRVPITSSFTGTDIVLFGVIEHDTATLSHRAGYDIVASVTGPRQSMVIRRKERVFGFWVNTGSRDVPGVPYYLATLSSKPLPSIASDETLRQLHVGSSRALMPRQGAIGAAGDVSPDDPYQEGLLRLKTRQRLYVEAADGVTFLTPTLFRASISLPAEAPVGTYEVEVSLFADGAPIAQTRSGFEVAKDGFEQFVESAARNHGLPYGLVTVATALMTGWFASVAFRRS